MRTLCISAIAVLFVFALSACGGGGGTEAAGDKSLETLNFSAASAADAGVYGLEEVGEGQQAPPDYASYGPITDASGAMSMQVPTEWAETANTPAEESVFQAALAASPNFDGYSSGWDIPGTFVGVSKSLGQQIAAAELADVKLAEVFAGISPRDVLKENCDPTVTEYPIRAGEQNAFAANLTDLLEFGTANLYSNCGGQGGNFIDYAGLSKDRTSFVYQQIGLVTGQDIGATLKMLQTLSIDFTKVPDPATEQEEDPELIVP